MLVYDPQVVAALHHEQLASVADSEALTAEDWAKRPLLLKILQNVARLFDSVL
jgi:hypothetical protein